MSADFLYLLAGASLLLAVILPVALSRAAISAPMVLLSVGALMGTGLAIDRPLEWRRWTTWPRWGATWRLLGIAMPLCIVGVAMLGWWVMGLAPAAASLGPFTEWGLRWFGWELVGKTLLGVVAGSVVGWVLAKAAFRGPRPSLRLAESGEPLLALAAVLLSYGISETLGGYGFLGVFACAMTLRSAERGHDYHVHMHQIVQRLERLLTLVVLLLLGVAMTNGLLNNLTWAAVAVGLLLVLVVRPLPG